MSNKFQDFKTKLQENKKFQIQFVSVITACVVVLACAITIPVAVHTNNVKKAMTVEAENSTSDIAVTEEMSEPETTANEVTTVGEETSTIADITNKTTPNSNNSSNSGSAANNGSSSSNKGGSSGSPNNRPNTTTTKPVTTTKKETTTEDDRWNWTQADVDATVAEVRRYAISKGYSIDSSLTEVGTSWMSPLDTRWDSKLRGVSDLKYQVDRLYAADMEEWGQVDSHLTLNIFSKNCSGYWEIYVVY